jgi:hypothetical protein
LLYLTQTQAVQSEQSVHLPLSQQQVLAFSDFLLKLFEAKTVAPASISVAQTPKITFFILL